VEEKFEASDLNGDGFLDIDELHALFMGQGARLTAADLFALRKDMDINGDMKISLDEFLAAVKKYKDMKVTEAI